MRGIGKRFAGATALDAVDFELGEGEVHALVGENGAGKSTLVRIMTGACRRDSGEMLFAGRPVTFDTPADAQGAGVSAVPQEIHLLRYRTVAENVFLGREPLRWGFIDWRRMNAEAATLLGELGLDVDPRATLGQLGTARQQLVAIARGMSLGARVLVLDEPTSSLADREVAILYGLIRRLRQQRTSVVYISHRFDELYDLCDRVTVLRDGRHVATRPLAELPRLDLVRLMLGRSPAVSQRRTPTLETNARHAGESTPGTNAPLLRAEGLERGNRLRGVTLDVRRGEIVGLAGLLGSGRTETAEALFGAAPADRGAVHLHERRLDPRSPGDAIKAGMGFLSEDRKSKGIIPDLSVRENLTLAALPTLSRFGVVSRARQRQIVERFMRRLGIKATSGDQKISELSGGNQQKVLLARWLCTTPALLILDEPTRGVDIGAKAEIQALVAELAAEGLGVLMISSELEELVEASARVVVLRDGRSVAELGRDELSPQAIMHAMASVDAGADFVLPEH